MKNLLLFMALSFGLTLCAQHGEYKKNFRHEFRFAQEGKGSILAIQNINGSLTVEGHDGDQVVVEVLRTLKTESADQREKGESEVQLGVVEKDKAVLLYLKTPCSAIDPATITSEQIRKGINNSWGNNCQWKPRYDFRLDFKVKVPRHSDLRISTINEGDIEVKNVVGHLNINHVNGPIRLEGIKAGGEARTINGDLIVRYSGQPAGDASYYTLNGKLEVFVPAGLSADLSFKTFNGEFYSDLSNLENMAPELEKLDKPKGEGVSFKVGNRRKFRSGKGGVNLDFETFNGDVYLRGQ